MEYNSCDVQEIYRKRGFFPCAHSDHHRHRAIRHMQGVRGRVLPHCLRSHILAPTHPHKSTHAHTSELVPKWVTREEKSNATTLHTRKTCFNKPMLSALSGELSECGARPSLYLIILLPLPDYKMYYVSRFLFGVVCLRFLTLRERSSSLSRSLCLQTARMRVAGKA